MTKLSDTSSLLLEYHGKYTTITATTVITVTVFCENSVRNINTTITMIGVGDFIHKMSNDGDGQYCDGHSDVLVRTMR